MMPLMKGSKKLLLASIVLLILVCLASGAKKKEKEEPAPAATIQVIGAGWSGSGTDILAKALNILGLGPTYSMFEILNGKVSGHEKKWIDHADGRRSMDFKKEMENYTSVVDFPAVAFYEDLVAAYPEAKVVLTHVAGTSWALAAREGPFKWQTAWPRKLMGLVLGSSGLVNDMNDKTQGPLFSKFRQGRPVRMEEEQSAVKTLKEWEAAVKEKVPADRLLEWTPAQGWQPLCDFLGKPVPSKPLPAAEEKGGYGVLILWDLGLVITALVLSVVALFGLGYLLGRDSGWDECRKHFKIRTKVHRE